MKKRKILLFILAVVLLVIAGVGFYIYREYNRVHESTAKMKADYTIGADSLIANFQSNEQSANKKYWDKIVQVSGVVKEIAKDDKGGYNLAMGDTSSMSAVRCSMDSTYRQQTALLKVGDSVNIKGVCAGYNSDELLGSDVILVRCSIISAN